MKKKIGAIILAMVMLLTGCSWMDGSYVYVEPHIEQQDVSYAGNVSAANYVELVRVLEQQVSAGNETCTIDIGEFDRESPEGYVNAACRHIQNTSAMGAYAVDSIEYEIGTNNGRKAIAVNISYRRSRAEIQRIRKKADMDEMTEAVYSALEEHSSRIVFLVENYSDVDFQAVVRDYAREQPQSLMEIPQISEGVYGTGTTRVVELNFTYQNTREALRHMQAQVKPVFEAAALYVSGEGSDHQKYSQLFGFLVERFEYKLETSTTPAYSLLCYGVGDSRAFAEVYAAMCRQAGLECLVITGTRDGAPWTWNMVLDGDNYFHVDLLRKSASGNFQEYADSEMTGYVWDYSAYPVCDVFYREPVILPATEPTVPQETQEQTVPQETEAPEASEPATE